MTPDEFDRWLTRVREDGYLQLTRGGRSIPQRKREYARDLPAQFMRVLMWLAYRMMSHCYGILMSLIAIDLAETEHKPSKAERVIFRLEHCQMDFLAGLPLDFLDRAQLRWIIRPWHRLLTMLAHPEFPGMFARGDFSFDSFMHFPRLLGFLAVLVRERREADSRDKDTESAKTISLDAPPPLTNKNPRSRQLTEEEDADRDRKIKPANVEVAHTDLPTPIRLTSTRCPDCGDKLQGDRVEDFSDETHALFWGYCRKCNTSRLYVADLEELKETIR